MTRSGRRSAELHARAVRVMPGGVNSPVRAWGAVGGEPVHLARGEGARVWDVDGNGYVDLVLAYGPLILGHAHPAVVEALAKAARAGTALGAPTEGELELALLVSERVPGIEMLRLVSSGTEATMSALRLARAATGRERVIKLEGCYHGHGDSFLVKAGSGALTHGAPDSPGVPRALAELTLVAPYNDLGAIESLLELHPREVACVFVEPVAGNVGCIPPEPGYLTGLRELCDRSGALLVLDEVMTGFRVARGGAVEAFGVRPDLVTLGKILGGGLPIGAYGGPAELMRRVSPAGDVYQAGTLSGNPLAVGAGLATLRELERPETYAALERAGARLQSGLEEAARAAGVPLRVQRAGSMLCPYFASAPVRNLADATASDRERWTRFFRGMLERGVHLPPSPYEAWFLSTTHDDTAIDEVVAAARGAFATTG